MSNVTFLSFLFLGKSVKCIADVANVVPKSFYTCNFRLPTRVAESFQGKRFYLINYEGESNENRKNVFKFNLLNESGTQLYHFST
jgi:hypothetical protein